MCEGIKFAHPRTRCRNTKNRTRKTRQGFQQRRVCTSAIFRKTTQNWRGQYPPSFARLPKTPLFHNQHPCNECIGGVPHAACPEFSMTLLPRKRKAPERKILPLCRRKMAMPISLPRTYCNVLLSAPFFPLWEVLLQVTVGETAREGIEYFSCTFMASGKEEGGKVAPPARLPRSKT